MRTSEWIPPSSEADAISRKEQAGLEMQRIQSSLSDRNKTVNGRRMTEHEYWTWNREAKLSLTANLEEIKRLKCWLALNHEQTKRQRLADTQAVSQNPVQEAAQAFNRLTAYAFDLQSNYDQLLAENESLRAQLMELKADPQNRTSMNGYEHWRDEHDPQGIAPFAPGKSEGVG